MVPGCSPSASNWVSVGDLPPPAATDWLRCPSHWCSTRGGSLADSVFKECACVIDSCFNSSHTGSGVSGRTYQVDLSLCVGHSTYLGTYPAYRSTCYLPNTLAPITDWSDTMNDTGNLVSRLYVPAVWYSRWEVSSGSTPSCWS